MTNTMTVSEMAKLGGQARAKLSKKELSRIGKTGGRPKKVFLIDSEKNGYVEPQKKISPVSLKDN
jgi:hypothetical protein